MTGSPRKLHHDFLETQIDGETVLMAIGSNEFFTLRDTGARIWALIDGRRDRAAIAAALHDDFYAPKAIIEDELDAFLRQLRESGFVA